MYGHKKKKEKNARHRGLEQWSKQVYVNETQYRLLFIHKTQHYLSCTIKVTLLLQVKAGGQCTLIQKMFVYFFFLLIKTAVIYQMMKHYNPACIQTALSAF